MSSDSNHEERKGVDRRQFLAVGAAGLAAAGVGIPAVAMAEPKAPGDKLKTNSKTGVRTIVITDAQLNIGPSVVHSSWSTPCSRPSFFHLKGLPPNAPKTFRMKRIAMRLW